MTPCSMRGHVDRHFAGTVSTSDERLLRAHLPECTACREYYARNHLLAQLDPAAIRPEERIGQALGVKPRGNVWPYAASALALAACVLLFLRSPATTDGFTARGATVTEAASHVIVYQGKEHREPARAGASIGAHDELAFAYENGAGKPRLMIFGTDEHAHVYWFYPAWTRPEDDPSAVPIATDGVRHELGEAIAQPFDGKQLAIRALFVDGATTVHEVERLLEAHPSGPLPIPGAVESTTSFSVVP